MLPRVIGMRDEAGASFGAAVILQDVTRLRLLDEVKTNLVSTVSHELKTPLTSVRMGLHLLLEERIGALNDKQTELLLAAREDSERLLRMINDLLDLAKLESGRVAPARPSRWHRAELVGARRSRFAGARGVARLAPGHEDRAGPARGLRRCASRSRTSFPISSPTPSKHTKAGEEIVLRGGDPRRRRALLGRSITGAAFPSSIRAVSSTASSASPASEVTGAGLGLAIARRSCTAQGGTIGVHSTPGEGSEFYFDLPPASTGGMYELNYPDRGRRAERPAQLSRDPGSRRVHVMEAESGRSAGATARSTISTSRSSICGCRRWTASICWPKCASAGFQDAGGDHHRLRRCCPRGARHEARRHRLSQKPLTPESAAQRGRGCPAAASPETQSLRASAG